MALLSRNDMKREKLGGPRIYAEIAILLVLGLVIAVPVARVATARSPDFRNHYRRAMELPAETTDRPVGHVLYHAVVKVIRQVLRTVPDSTVQLISTLTFMLPVPAIIFYTLKKTNDADLPNLLTGALALGLTVASPITIWLDNPYMIGYINSIVYHNPTLIALRPFVIPLFLMSLWAIQRREYCNRSHRNVGHLEQAQLHDSASASIGTVRDLASATWGKDRLDILDLGLVRPRRSHTCGGIPLHIRCWI